MAQPAEGCVPTEGSRPLASVGVEPHALRPWCTRSALLSGGRRAFSGRCGAHLGCSYPPPPSATRHPVNATVIDAGGPLRMARQRYGRRGGPSPVVRPRSRLSRWHAAPPTLMPVGGAASPEPPDGDRRLLRIAGSKPRFISNPAQGRQAQRDAPVCVANALNQLAGRGHSAAPSSRARPAPRQVGPSTQWQFSSSSPARQEPPDLVNDDEHYPCDSPHTSRCERFPKRLRVSVALGAAVRIGRTWPHDRCRSLCCTPGGVVSALECTGRRHAVRPRITRAAANYDLGMTMNQTERRPRSCEQRLSGRRRHPKSPLDFVVELDCVRQTRPALDTVRVK